MEDKTQNVEFMDYWGERLLIERVDYGDEEPKTMIKLTSNETLFLTKERTMEVIGALMKLLEEPSA